MKAVQESAFGGDESKVEECQCLPSCTDYDYPGQASHSAIISANMLKLSPSLKEEQQQLNNISFVTNNVAVLHVYFR